VEVTDNSTSSSVDWINLVGISGGEHQVAGTLVGLRAEARVVQIDHHTLDVPPSAHLTVIRNDDRPGVIGRVGTIVGAAGVNIDDMDVGRSPEGASALMVISTDVPVSDALADELRAAEGIVSVTTISA
ncbi:ACT domain-containing protein, partial [Acinetobacter baumannii]|uniref:ACT domain-containing protein n=1 Tax=Acinetobacter baumannii TaxID=470 RepID=UPI00189A6034